jgi:dethiobiotin synthetase
MRRTLFITGTDTGAGKTVLTVLLTQFLRARGINAAALKPICSGGRDDVDKIFAAMNGALSLDEINPWHFRAPVSPLLAARRERKRVKLSQVLSHARAMQKRFDVLLVEGAGGLLSPLGAGFNSRDLIRALRPTPIIACPNRLGAVNQVLLVLEALPKSSRAGAHVVLVSPPKPDASAKTNAKLLGRFLSAGKIFPLPWLGRNFSRAEALKIPEVERTLGALAQI